MEQVFFKNIQSTIITELQQATQSIQIAVCWFTNKAIFDVLAQKASEGVPLSIILLDDYANKRKEGLPISDLIGLGAKIYFSDKTAPIHHKFCVIDKITVLSGSYDWTYFSESKALENLILIKENQDLANAFVSEFEMLISVLTPVDKVEPYSMPEGLVKDTFGLKNYLSEDVYLQALKADENGEDLNALNLMHHSAQIDEYKAEAQTEFIKEKQAKPEENETVSNSLPLVSSEEETTEEETTSPTPIYTSRGIGLGFSPTPPPAEENVEESSPETIEPISSEDNTEIQEDTNNTITASDALNNEDAATITTEQIPTEEVPIVTENQPVAEVNNEIVTESQPVTENTASEPIPDANVFIPNPEAEGAIQQGEMAYQQGRLEDAVQFFTQAIMMQGNNPKAYLNLAIVKWRMGRFSEQAEFAAQSIQHDPTNAKLLIHWHWRKIRWATL